VGQVVPLKIVTSSKSADWSEWNKKYPLDKRGIPQLYVVRADGELLYGDVGSLPGDTLLKMLDVTVGRAGRTFSNAEAAAAAKAVADARAAIESADVFSAAAALESLIPLGFPSELNSYAAWALEAEELYQQLQSETAAAIESGRPDLFADDPQASFAAVLAFATAEAVYRSFPPLRSKAGALAREIARMDELDDRFDAAEALVKARAIAASTNDRIRRRAGSAYGAVIRRFPGTPADELARTEFAQIDPQARILQTGAADHIATDQPDEPKHEFRTWTAASGKFTTMARFVERRGDHVKLQKKNGKSIVVRVDQLSRADRKFLAGLKRPDEVENGR